jgi:hypothetical protein
MKITPSARWLIAANEAVVVEMANVDISGSAH